MEHVTARSLDPAMGPTFTSAVADVVLLSACAQVGLVSVDAQMLRLGENAIYQVGDPPVIVRIARGEHLLPSVAREVAVANWLMQEGLPAARVVPDLRQPIVVDGHPVTFWEFIDRGADQPTYGDLGRILRQLHELTPPPELALPDFDVFARTARRITTAEGIDDDVRAFLAGREAELRERLSALTFPSVPSALHGDAHVANLMRSPGGEVALIDFENFALGHREWDLVVTGDEYESTGWTTERQYRDFVEAYGFDITKWSGYEVLRDVQEFKMTTWLMQNLSGGAEVAEEFERRLSSIRDGTTRRTWRPF